MCRTRPSAPIMMRTGTEVNFGPAGVGSMRNEMLRGRIIFDADRCRMGGSPGSQRESIEALREASALPGIGRRQVEADEMAAALGDQHHLIKTDATEVEPRKMPPEIVISSGSRSTVMPSISEMLRRNRSTISAGRRMGSAAKNWSCAVISIVPARPPPFKAVNT